MTNNIYIIDASSLIALNIHNPIDVFPSVWVKLATLISKDFLVSPKEVLKEIHDKDSKLSDWVKKQKNLFKEPTQRQLEIVGEILSNYPSIIKVDRKTAADPFVIALAVEIATRKQKTLFEVKRIVVTEERLVGNKIRIPFICQKYNIDSVNVVDMFRTEGITF